MPGCDLESGGQAARQWLALDHGHRVPALCEAERNGQPERAGAEDCCSDRHGAKPTRAALGGDALGTVCPRPSGPFAAIRRYAILA